jgi:hypothetical protein
MVVGKEIAAKCWGEKSLRWAEVEAGASVVVCCRRNGIYVYRAGQAPSKTQFDYASQDAQFAALRLP